MGADAAPAPGGRRSCWSRATSSTAGGTGASSSCSPRRRSSTTCRPRDPPRTSGVRPRKALLALAVAFDLGLLGYFKYADFFLSSVDNVRPPWAAVELVGALRDAPDRHLLLHVHGDLVRRRHLPGPARARVASRASRCSRRSSRISSPGRSSAASELLPQLERPRDPRRVDASRAFFLILSGSLLQGRDREPAVGAHRRRGVRRARPALVARGAGRRLRVRGADLRGLLRLHEHRDRRRAAARVRVPAELRLAVRRRSRSRTSGGAGT